MQFNTFRFGGVQLQSGCDSCGMVVTHRGRSGDREHSRGKSQHNVGGYSSEPVNDLVMFRKPKTQTVFRGRWSAQ